MPLSLRLEFGLKPTLPCERAFAGLPAEWCRALNLKLGRNPQSSKSLASSKTRIGFQGFRLEVTAGLSGDLLAGVATLALKSRLAAYESVETGVKCTLPGLLSGYVERVQILGTGWRSPLELRCRTLEVSVDDVQLDVSALMARQVIALRRPPLGYARISFTASDFGYFLGHQLMVDAGSVAVKGEEFLFLPELGVRMRCRDGDLHPKDAVTEFKGRWRDEVFTVELGVGDDRKTVELKAYPYQEEGCDRKMTPHAEIVEEGLNRFFGNLCLNFDGTEMLFDGMDYFWHEGKDGGQELAMLLDLKVCVNAFPPPTVSF